MPLLFLDDIRNPIDCLGFKHTIIDKGIYLRDWEIVRSHAEFVAWIEINGLPDLISFDHDLGLTELPECKEQNGLTCAKWLVNYCLDNELPLPECVVHSQNPVGRENIEGLLCQFRRLGNL